MGELKNGKEMTKADVMLSKLDQLTKKVASLEARIGNGGGSGDGSSANVGAIRKLSEENAQLRKDISYVSAQIEGLYAALTKMITKLPENLAAKGGSALNMDVDDLASRVAAKIIIPEGGYGDVES
ncbi:MAG: hypothetical protein K2K39_02060, partial [Clostridia bacterium]|nr:hypothetical protein [Clostridia bacterium]